MKIQNTKYFEGFNLVTDQLKGRQIEKILCCLIDLQEPKYFRFDNLQGCDFGFDFILDNGKTIHFQVGQIGYSFGLLCGFGTIRNRINEGPKLWDLTSEDFVTPIINQPVTKVEFKTVRNVAGENFQDKIEFIHQIEFHTTEDSFMIVAAEYLPEKDNFNLEADEATLIVGKEVMEKYRLKMASQ